MHANYKTFEHLTSLKMGIFIETSAQKLVVLLNSCLSRFPRSCSKSKDMAENLIAVHESREWFCALLVFCFDYEMRERERKRVAVEWWGKIVFRGAVIYVMRHKVAFIWIDIVWSEWTRARRWVWCSVDRCVYIREGNERQILYLSTFFWNKTWTKHTTQENVDSYNFRFALNRCIYLKTPK